MHIYMIDIYMLYIYIKCIFLSLCCLLWRQWDGTACVVSGNSTEIVCGCCSSNFHSLLVKKRFGVGGKIAVVLLFFGTELIWINNSLCVFLLQWRLSIFSWPAESLSITFLWIDGLVWHSRSNVYSFWYLIMITYLRVMGDRLCCPQCWLSGHLYRVYCLLRERSSQFPSCRRLNLFGQILGTQLV